MQEYRAGAARFKGIRRVNDAHQIEDVGAKLRAMMPWIKQKALVNRERKLTRDRGAELRPDPRFSAFAGRTLSRPPVAG